MQDIMNWHRDTSGLILPGSDPFERRRRSIVTPTANRGMSRRRCCCGGCTVFSDDFSSDDLAENWTVRSGSWSVGSGVLSTSSSNAVLTCNTSYPGDGFHNHVLQVSLQASTGNRSRIIFSYDSTAGTYNYVEVYWNGTSSYVYVKTIAGATVSTSAVQSYTNGTWYVFRLCIFDGYVVVDSLFDGAVAIDSTTTVFGVGSGSLSSSVAFGVCSLQHHKVDMNSCLDCVPAGATTCAHCLGDYPSDVVVKLKGFGLGSDGEHALPRYGGFACGWAATFSGTKNYRIAVLVTPPVSPMPGWCDPPHVSGEYWLYVLLQFDAGTDCDIFIWVYRQAGKLDCTALSSYSLSEVCSGKNYFACSVASSPTNLKYASEGTLALLWP